MFDRRLLLVFALVTAAAAPVTHPHPRPASLPVPPIPPAHPPPDRNAPVPDRDVLPPPAAAAERRLFIQTTPDLGKVERNEDYPPDWQYRARPTSLLPMLGLGVHIPLQ